MTKCPRCGSDKITTFYNWAVIGGQQEHFCKGCQLAWEEDEEFVSSIAGICSHVFVDTGMPKSWCKYCDVDGLYRIDAGRYMTDEDYGLFSWSTSFWAEESS